MKKITTDEPVAVNAGDGFVVGNAKGEGHSAVRTGKGDVEGGNSSAVLGTRCKIGDNSVGLCIDNSGKPTEIVVSCERTVPITYDNQSSNWCKGRCNGRSN